jgi:biotin carboxyl carrier protein
MPAPPQPDAGSASKNGANGSDPRVGGSPPRSKRRWLYAVLVLALLFVLMPFLFWQATWFGRPLDDAQIAKFLDDREHPRNAQHALAQIEQRIESPDPAVRASARQWYPDIIRVAAQGGDELRLTAAWVMGQDNSAPAFHQALLTLLDDANPMVRRNAALGLVRFSDAAGHDEIVSMLSPCTLSAPSSGTIATRLKPGETLNAGTMVGRIVDGNQKTEVRSQVPGTLDRWLVADGATVLAGQPIAVLDPSSDMVWEALRGLYFIGRADDLPAVESLAHGVSGFPPQIQQQAELTAQAISSRSRH